MLSLHVLANFKVQELDSTKYNVRIVKESCGDFYHYGHEGIKDMGWGCGYRSLQSLCSWAVKHSIKHQHSTVPSILKIQQTLVEVGDKSSSFINSKEWIGCYEGSIVLDQLYEVSCRLVHIRCGNEVTGICEQLSSHFESIGSPIMIGGDMDASSKTLVGVASSRNKRECDWKFLIADPHYVGSDEHTEIVKNNAAISWHNAEIFEQSSFYNFCIPIK